jgi:hypothetical protein
MKQSIFIQSVRTNLHLAPLPIFMDIILNWEVGNCIFIAPKE